jgi:hypothetical protein
MKNRKKGNERNTYNENHTTQANQEKKLIIKLDSTPSPDIIVHAITTPIN